MSENWKRVLISKTDTIKKALSLLDSEGLRVAIVIENDYTLLGIVTDGDVRRGLLRNLTIDNNVSDVMMTSPITAPVNTPREELVNIMQSNDILAIPLMSDGKLVGLETLREAIAEPVFENPVFLMAGGFGTRLRPLTDNCPKPLLQIGGTPILETTLLRFIKEGFRNFYISTHYMPEMIRDYFGDGRRWNIRITYIHEESPLGTGGALGLLPADIPDLPIVMMNGDILTKVNFITLLNFHNTHNAIATMAVREYEYQIPYGVVSGEGNKIRKMEEKPIQRFFVNAGIYIVNPALAKNVPRNHYIDMPTLLEQQIAAKHEVHMFPIHEYWIDIGRIEDFNRAQSDIHDLGF